MEGREKRGRERKDGKEKNNKYSIGINEERNNWKVEGRMRWNFNSFLNLMVMN